MALTDREEQQLENQERQQRLQKFLGTVDRASRRDPDTTARHLRLSEETGVSYPTVQSHEEEVERNKRLKSYGLEEIEKRSPKAFEWLGNERNASIAHDDIENLEALEKSVTDSNTERSWFDNQKARVMETFADIFEHGGKAATMYGRMTPAGLAGLMMDPEGAARTDKAQKEFFQEMGDAAKRHWKGEHRGDIQAVIDDPTPETVLNFIKEEGLPNVPYLLAAGISQTLVTGVVASQIAEDRAKNDGHEGIVTPDDYVQALRYAVPSAILDRLSFGRLAKAGAEAGKRSFMRYLGKELPKAMVTEGGTEFVQEGIEAYGGMVGTRKGVQTDEMFAQALGGMLVGSALGGGFRMATAYPEYQETVFRQSAKRAFENLDAARSLDKMDELFDLAQSSKLSERSIDDLAGYIKELNPEGHVFIDPDIIQEIEDAPDYVLEQVDGTGAMVSVPIDQFIKDFVAVEGRLETVRDHIKIRENLKTRNELANDQTTQEYVENLIKRAEKARDAKTEAETIYEQVKDQIVGTGRQSEATARLSAELIPAYAAAKHDELKRRGIDVSVKQVYDDMGLRIVGPQVDAEKELGEQVQTIDQTPDFGDLEVTSTTKDAAGNTVRTTEKAQKIWDFNTKRNNTLEALRKCMTT